MHYKVNKTMATRKEELIFSLREYYLSFVFLKIKLGVKDRVSRGESGIRVGKKCEKNGSKKSETHDEGETNEANS